MKKVRLHANTVGSIMNQMLSEITEALAYILDEDPEYGYIRVVNGESPTLVFIRLLPSKDYEDNKNRVFLNAYVNYMNDGMPTNSLLFSEYINSKFIDVTLDLLVARICEIFEFKDNGDFHVTIISGIKTYRKIELESMCPQIMENMSMFCTFVENQLMKLDEHSPSFLLMFQAKMGDMEDGERISLWGTGCFYLQFLYNDHLSDKYGEPIYTVTGILPSITTEDGFISITDAIGLDYVRVNVPDWCRWYFSLKGVLQEGEWVKCYAETLPYFQKII